MGDWRRRTTRSARQSEYSVGAWGEGHRRGEGGSGVWDQRKDWPGAKREGELAGGRGRGAKRRGQTRLEDVSERQLGGREGERMPHNRSCSGGGGHRREGRRWAERRRRGQEDGRGSFGRTDSSIDRLSICGRRSDVARACRWSLGELGGRKEATRASSISTSLLSPRSFVTDHRWPGRHTAG